MVTTVAVLMALWGVGFATVNIVFEATGRFDGAEFAPYARTLAVLDWLVVVLKLVAAAAAILSIAPRPGWLRPNVLAVVLWGVFATLAVYVTGSLAEAIALLTGIMGDPGGITPMSILYVLFFLFGAVGFGVLAVSFHRRHRCRTIVIVLGVLCAPVVLGGLLFVLPTLLSALG